MKTPGLLLICGILSGTLFAQNVDNREAERFINSENMSYSPLFYFHKLFFDSISKDQFLFAQRYADFQCQGYTITLNHPETDPKMDITNWIYAQDFSLYEDTAKYFVIYEAIAYDYGFHFEYFKLFDKTSSQLIRHLMVSYEIHSNRIVALFDSNIHW